MENQKAKEFKLWYQIFMIIALLSLADVATNNAVQQSYNLSGVGYVSICFFFLFKALFGIKVATVVLNAISTVFSLSVGWLVPSYFMNKKYKFIENPSDENKKDYKIAKVVAWIFGGIILFIIFK